MSRFRKLAITASLFATTSLLVLPSAGAVARRPTAVTHGTAHVFITAPPPGSSTLYDQNGNSTGSAISSQIFAPPVATL